MFLPFQRQLTGRCVRSAGYVSTGAKKALHGQKVSWLRAICVLFRDEIQHGEDRMTVGPERSSKNRFFVEKSSARLLDLPRVAEVHRVRLPS